MKRSPLLLLVPALALALPACSDYQLYPAAPDRGDSPDLPPPSHPPLDPDRDPPVVVPVDPAPADPPGGPDSPWPDPNPGNLPDLVFVAPWSTSNLVMDYEGSYPGADIESLDWSFVAFDLQGQVLLELELPDQEGRRTNPKSVDAAGPGRFLASIHWQNEETAETGWEAWLIDAISEEMELVVSWNDTDGTVWLPQAEREIEIADGPILLHLALWPTDPDRIVLWAEDFGPQPSLPPLRVAHIHDAGVPDSFYDPGTLFAAQSGMGPMVPWDLDVVLGPDGEPVILGGTRLAGDSADGLPLTGAWSLTAWSPTLGSFWSTDIDWPGIKYEAALGIGAEEPVATAYGDQSLWETDWTPLLAWSEEGAEVAAVAEQGWKRVGPVLDPAGPTVTTIGMTSAGGWRDQIDIFHEGDQVWRIEELRFGLVERTGFFGQLILLETPETD